MTVVYSSVADATTIREQMGKVQIAITGYKPDVWFVGKNVIPVLLSIGFPQECLVQKMFFGIPYVEIEADCVIGVSQGEMGVISLSNAIGEAQPPDEKL